MESCIGSLMLRHFISYLGYDIIILSASFLALQYRSDPTFFNCFASNHKNIKLRTLNVYHSSIKCASGRKIITGFYNLQDVLLVILHGY